MSGEMAGVGLFFQQDAQGTIFVASLTPGAAADRTGVIQKGDIVLKVDDVTVTGMTLTKVRDYVLGHSGTVCCITFRRPSAANKFCYDADLVRGSGEFLDIVEKNNDYAAQKDKISQLLQKNQKDILAIEADINTLSNHPPMKIEDPRVKELANELKSRSEDLRQLQDTRIRTKERLTDAERRKMETQTRLERECAEKLSIESRLRTVKNESTDFERAFEEEFALWKNVQEKLKHDVDIELSSKQLAEETLSQAMVRFNDMKAQMLDLRLKEQRISRCLSNVHDALEKASRLNEVVGQELHAYTPALDAAQGWFLNELVTTLRANKSSIPPIPQPPLRLVMNNHQAMQGNHEPFPSNTGDSFYNNNLGRNFTNVNDNGRSMSQTAIGNTQINTPALQSQQNVVPGPRTPRSPIHHSGTNVDIDIDSLVMKYGLSFDDPGYVQPKPPATPPRPNDLQVLA